MDEPPPQESHCKFNDKTERCIINPDPSATQDDHACYKTDKNRCAVKKKKIIKIKPKESVKESAVKESAVKESIKESIKESQTQIQATEKSKDDIDFLYPDLNDKNFNLKLAEKKEFYDTRNTEEVLKNKEFIERADKLCNAPYELQSHQYFVKNFMSFQTPYNSLLLFHGLGSGKTCSAIGVSENMRDYLNQVGMKQEIILVSNTNVKNNFKKELFDITKLHRNESGNWTMNGCTGNKFLKEINLDLFNGAADDDDDYTPENEEKIKMKIKKQIDKIIKKSYSFIGYQKFSSIIRMLLDADKSNIQKQRKPRKDASVFKGEEEGEGEGEGEETEEEAAEEEEAEEEEEA